MRSLRSRSPSHRLRRWPRPRLARSPPRVQSASRRLRRPAAPALDSGPLLSALGRALPGSSSCPARHAGGAGSCSWAERSSPCPTVHTSRGGRARAAAASLGASRSTSRCSTTSRPRSPGEAAQSAAAGGPPWGATVPRRGPRRDGLRVRIHEMSGGPGWEKRMRAVVEEGCATPRRPGHN